MSRSLTTFPVIWLCKIGREVKLGHSQKKILRELNSPDFGQQRWRTANFWFYYSDYYVYYADEAHGSGRLPVPSIRSPKSTKHFFSFFRPCIRFKSNFFQVAVSGKIPFDRPIRSTFSNCVDGLLFRPLNGWPPFNAISDFQSGGVPGDFRRLPWQRNWTCLFEQQWESRWMILSTRTSCEWHRFLATTTGVTTTKTTNHSIDVPPVEFYSGHRTDLKSALTRM